MSAPLSRYFTWTEALASQSATRAGIDNTPSPDEAETIVATARKLDTLRDYLRAPILVSSWYRCFDLNALIGGSRRSQHMAGEAVDFTAPGFGNADMVFAAICTPHAMSMLGIDQVIREYPEHENGGWVHVSFTQAPRMQALVVDQSGTRPA